MAKYPSRAPAQPELVSDHFYPKSKTAVSVGGRKKPDLFQVQRSSSESRKFPKRMEAQKRVCIKVKFPG